MADIERMFEALRNADAAGDTAAATRLAQMIREVQNQPERTKEQQYGKLGPSGAEWGPIEAFSSGAWQNLGADIKAGAAAAKESLTGGLPFSEAFSQARSAYGAARDKYREESPITSTALETAGSLATAVPLTAGIAAPASAGGAVVKGGLSSLPFGTVWGAGESGGDIGERLESAGKGGATAAGIGAVLGPIGYGVSRMVSPQTPQQIRQLMAEGVTPTPGQISGGAGRWIEETLTNVPVLGSVIKGAQRRAVQDLNTAAINRVLEPLGERLPKGIKAGQEAVAYADDALEAAYNKVLPQIKFGADKKFLDDVSNVLSESVLSPDNKARLASIVQDDILGRITPREGGKFVGSDLNKGEIFKLVKNKLHALSSLSSSSNGEERLLGEAAKKIQRAAWDTVERLNPSLAPELKAVDRAYANFVRVERAAGGVGTMAREAGEEALFSPAALRSAVRAEDKTMRKGQFARGEALMQDLADAGQTVLGQSIPDSGTASRVWPLLLAAGAGLHLPAATGAALASAPYMHPATQRMMAALMTSRPDIAQPIARGIRQSIVPGAAAMSPMTQALGGR